MKALDAAADDLADRGEVVDPMNALNLVPPVAWLERQAVNERDQRADRLRAAKVGDVHAFDPTRGGLHVQDFLQSFQPLSRIDVKHLGLGVLGEVAAQVQGLQRLDLVTQPRGLLEEKRGARHLHFLLHLGDDDVFLTVEEEAEAADVGAIRLAVHPQVARGRTLVDRMQQARAEPAPARVALFNIKRAGAEFEDSLEHLNGPSEALGAGEGAVELDASVERLAGEVHSWKIFARGDLEVGERLVVLEALIVLRLDVLDESGFHQEGVHLAVGGEKIDVHHLADPVGDSPVPLGSFLKIGARAGAQVFRLADVDDPPLGVLHQVQARRRRELSGLGSETNRVGRWARPGGRGRFRSRTIGVGHRASRGPSPAFGESWRRKTLGPRSTY